MPDYMRSCIEHFAVKVIYESFIVPADEDYLMSRLLAQKKFYRGFYWAAAQAVEKYLKAFLLMNGEGVKKYRGHSIKALFEAATKIDTTISALDILPHNTILIDDRIASHFRTFTATEFIEEIGKYGCPDNRYNVFGVEYNTGHLCALDSFSFKIRNKIGVLPITENFNKLSADMYLMFEKNNPWYQEEENGTLFQIPSKEFPILSSSNTTTLDYLKNNSDDEAYKLVLKWLSEKMKLPEIK